MSLQFFSTKDPDEILTLGMNFVNLLSVGETITSAVWEMEQADGTAVDPAMLLGNADFSGAPIVLQVVKGGVHQTTYLHRAKVTTSTGRVLVIGGWQQVIKGAC